MRPPAEMACWSPPPATRRNLARTLAIAAAVASVALLTIAALIARAAGDGGDRR